MKTPKLTAPGGLVLSTSVPIEQWGKDHWSTLAFIECLCVDNSGSLTDANRARLRCNDKTHPGYSLRLTDAGDWKPSYGSRLKGYWKPDGTQDKSRQLSDHDDWDCIEDFEAAGLLENLNTGMNPVFKLTEKGLALAAQVRAHKAGGGHFATFEPKL